MARDIIYGNKEFIYHSTLTHRICNKLFLLASEIYTHRAVLTEKSCPIDALKQLNAIKHQGKSYKKIVIH